MNEPTHGYRLRMWILVLLALPGLARGTGVTLITHGYGGNTDGWVTGMADAVSRYSRFPGTNFTTYKITVSKSGSSYLFATSRTNGSAPALTDSGEIIVKLDWRSLAGGLFPDTTYNVAAATALALQQTNLIAELGGHALTEFPMHLIGHSRGGSLVCELSRDLGTNGLWIDHLTTLDPHPLNNDGFSDIIFGVDAPARTYVNVLYHDNYWEDIQSYPYGEPVAGAYVRKLDNYGGGYGAGSEHSNVHLWYHGTIDWRTPISDREASITGAERTNWWVAYESQGVVAGFLYSLIGGGDRLSLDQPVGPGFQAIRDGFNQHWDLGIAGVTNRTLLPSNTGNWANLIRLNRLDTNSVLQGHDVPVKFYYQWAQPPASTANLSFYLDDDLNPLNANDHLLKQMTLPGTGTGYVSYASVALTLDATNASPGYHAIYARLTAGNRTRYLYAPEWVQVISSQAPPTLEVARFNSTQVVVGVNAEIGQTIVLQTSTDLDAWLPLITNTMAGDHWSYTNSLAAPPVQRFYRAVLTP